jgi:hypothetical protein
LITDFSFTTVTVQGGGTLEIDSIGNSMKLIGTELIIESGGVLIADFVDIEVNKLIVDQSGKIHANGKVISFSNFFFHSFFFCRRIVSIWSEKKRDKTNILVRKQKWASYQSYFEILTR